MHIAIDEEALSTIQISAKNCFPNECCGFLFGNESNIAFAVEVLNNSEKRKAVSFQISASDYIAAEKLAIERNAKLLGVYHSHPNEPARPSVEDYEAAFPNFLYLILSLSKYKINELKGWQLNHENAFEEQLIKSIN